MPTITGVNFDMGKLRIGAGNKVVDGQGHPIISTGHIQGGSDPIVRLDDNPVDPSKRYRITITSRNGGRTMEWKGRIIEHEPNQHYGWRFVVVLTKNEVSADDMGSGDGDTITVTVTNPDGSTSPGYTPPGPIPVATIP